VTHANHIFLITFCIITVGYIVKRLGFITEQDGKILSKFLMHTTFPALMLVSTVRLKLDTSLLAIPLMAFILGSIMLTIAWFVFKKEDNDIRGLMTMGSGGFNMGLFAFPIIEGIWGRDALAYAIIYDIGNTAVVFGLVYVLGNYFATKRAHHTLNNAALAKKIAQKILKSMPLQGMILGLLLNISGIGLPTLAMDCLDILAQANKAIGILLLGIYLNFTLTKSEIWTISKVLMIRYGCGLVAVAFCCFWMPPSVFQSIMIVCVVLPVGLTLLPFSDELQYDSRMAGVLVNMSLVISFLVMWSLVLGLGLV
jgi:malate permease and related proteins